MYHPSIDQIMLNIGLIVGRGPGANTPLQTLEAIERTGLIIEAMRVLPASQDAEPTVVVLVRVPSPHWGPRTVHDVVYGLAETLGQMAIAAWGPATRWGANIGPQAAAWGPFDRALFTHIDGHRLTGRPEPLARDQSEDRGPTPSLDELVALGKSDPWVGRI